MGKKQVACTKAVKLKVGEYKSRPLTVQGAYYDGSIECAKAFCEKWPEDFMIGMNEDDSVGGLFIVAGKNVLLVAPDEMVFRENDDSCFASIDNETFLKHFYAAYVPDCESCAIPLRAEVSA